MRILIDLTLSLVSVIELYINFHMLTCVSAVLYTRYTFYLFSWAKVSSFQFFISIFKVKVSLLFILFIHTSIGYQISAFV